VATKCERPRLSWTARVSVRGDGLGPSAAAGDPAGLPIGLASFPDLVRERERGPSPASPATAAAYLAHFADSGLKASTIGRRLAAIAYAHKLKGVDAPTSSEAVHAVLRGSPAPHRRCPGHEGPGDRQRNQGDA
jgi:hypothetical protein